MPDLIQNQKGGYSFLPGIEPYSSGVIADHGHELVHVRALKWMPWHDGMQAARRYVEAKGLTAHAICGVELRCAEPHSVDGFIDFNSQYRALLEDWNMIVDGLNPVARTNVSPVQDPPTETVLHGFSYSRPSDSPHRTFVVAGGGELPTRKLDRDRIVRVGESSDDAMLEKARCVVGIMQHRLTKLEADWSLLSAVDVYTAHPIAHLLEKALIPEFSQISRDGVHWFLSRPPIREIEFEMDMRGVFHEETVDLASVR